MKCDRCGKEAREDGINPPLLLKGLGLYPTERISLGTLTSVITASASFADSEIGTASVVLNNDNNNWLRPNSLHKLPGRPINSYLTLLNTAIILQADNAMTFCNFILQFEDIAGRLHTVLTYNSVAQHGSAMGFAQPTIVSPQMGERPTTIGRWRMFGTITLGAATSVVVTVYPNYGILYGAP